ncbi:hypothetical protein [Kineosporia succinea]|uniref:Alpha amylase inhibitor n=1 Tax=Kineosporia succinea TaxID=84632 RepID=A0ABT9NXG2_9ACTN|nr:hypothetical protein [Kineosporia succinea]MDP9825117.1 hypothetical protein [Kineosporia succinea]
MASTASGVAERPLAGCGQSATPSPTGARVHWETTCSGGNIRVKGYVIDTKADGKCAQARIEFGSGSTVFSARACPKGQQKNFDVTRAGSTAFVTALVD